MVDKPHEFIARHRLMLLITQFGIPVEHHKSWTYIGRLDEQLDLFEHSTGIEIDIDQQSQVWQSTDDTFTSIGVDALRKIFMKTHDHDRYR